MSDTPAEVVDAALECYARLWLTAEGVESEPKRGAPVHETGQAIEHLLNTRGGTCPRATGALVASAFGQHALDSSGLHAIEVAWRTAADGSRPLLFQHIVQRLVHFARQPYAREANLRLLRPPGLKAKPELAQAFADAARVLLA